LFYSPNDYYVSSCLSRTHTLVEQIKQITIEIRDIKEKNKFNTKKVKNTFSVHNRTWNGRLQEGHEEHDEHDVHYEGNIQTAHPAPDNMCNQEHCAPAQYPIPIVSTSSTPLPPELHPSSPSSGNPVKPVLSTTPWSKKPIDPESPANEGDNIGGVVGLPWTTTNGMTSGSANDDDPCAVDKKEGV